MRGPEILAQCLVEGDGARAARSRRLRRKALVLSIGLEAMLLAALLLAPLASPETLSRRLGWSPLPPFRGPTRVDAKPPAVHPASFTPHVIHTTILYAPIHILPEVNCDPEFPENDLTGQSSIADSGPAIPGNGIGVPFGAESGPAVPPISPVQIPVQQLRVIHRSEGAQTALLEHRVLPIYPPLAIQTRTQGEVKLHAIIATDGTIQSLEVESGNPLLVLAARIAVQQWRYKPALLNGQPVEVDTFITVIFHLDR